MKVRDVIAHHLSVDLKEPFGYAQRWVGTRTVTLVEIATDEGIVGYGESYGPPPPIQATIQELLRPMILGADPFDVDVLWERMYNGLRDFGQKGSAIAAISGIDIALWDIIGKKLDKPFTRS